MSVWESKFRIAQNFINKKITIYITIFFYQNLKIFLFTLEVFMASLKSKNLPINSL